MQLIRFTWSLLRPLRFLVIAFVCTLIFFSNALPVLALGSTPTDPRSGEAPLDEIFEKSEDVLKAEPRTMRELQSEAQKGYNEIQGDADFNSSEMKRPENSQNATSFIGEAEKALKKATNQD